MRLSSPGTLSTARATAVASPPAACLHVSPCRWLPSAATHLLDPPLQFMSSAPWYLNQAAPGLKHQKNWKDEVKDAKAWYDRGAKVFQANKWRKGACEK